METNIKQAVCESRDSEKVVKFLTENELTDEMVKGIENAVIWGVYYNPDGEIVAETTSGDILTNVLKPNK